MMPLRNLRNRAVRLEKSKENDKVPSNSRMDQKQIQLMVMSSDHNDLKDPKKTKTLDVATIKNCKKKPAMEHMNENNNAYAVNKSGKENVYKRNLRNKSEKLPTCKLSVLKENNSNLENIIPVAAVVKRVRENTKTKDQKSIKANEKLSCKSDSSKPSRDKKTCNLLQTKLSVLKESSNIEREGTTATIRKTKKNDKVKKETKANTQNKPIGKINCYMPIDNYFKKPLKENNCLMEGTKTETEINAVKKFPIWKKLDISKTDPAKRKQTRSTQDVYDISLDEDLLASSKKSRNTKTRVNHMKKRVRKDNKKRLNYPKSSIKTKCSSLKVDKKILATETQTATRNVFGEKTASKENCDLPENTNNDNILNVFHDGNKNRNILEQITSNVEIADVHHTENEFQNFPAELFKINKSNEILGHSEQIVNINNIEKADVPKESENMNFSASSFQIDHPNEILEHSDYDINNIESAGISNETENLNVPTASFEINNPNEILTDPSVDVQQSKRIANRKSITELANQLERSFQIYLTSTPDRSHKNRIPAQKSGIFNVADLSNISVVNRNCLDVFVSSPTDSLSDNVAVSAVTNADINNKNNNVITESLSAVEPPKKKPKKDDTADITLFESPKKNVEKKKKKPKKDDTADITLFESPKKNVEKKKKKQKPISFYLFQDLETPPAELEESVLKPKKTYKEADNFKVRIMKTKRNAGVAKQAVKQSKVDLLMESMMKHFDEIGSTELCIEKI